MTVHMPPASLPTSVVDLAWLWPIERHADEQRSRVRGGRGAGFALLPSAAAAVRLAIGCCLAAAASGFGLVGIFVGFGTLGSIASLRP